MFVHQTVGIRIIRTSTSGFAERSSIAIQAAISTAAPANRPMMRGDVQPQFSPSLTPSSRHTSQPESVSAAEMLTRPGALMGDSGIRNIVAAIEITAMPPGIQNSQWYERLSTIGPASTIAKPAPMPMMAEIRPIAPATRSRGSSSRMMLNASGKIAPPPPWTMRATIITAIESVVAATTEPTASDASTATSTRFLPNMSPRRPRIGVATEADSR